MGCLIKGGGLGHLSVFIVAHRCHCQEQTDVSICQERSFGSSLRRARGRTVEITALLGVKTGSCAYSLPSWPYPGLRPEGGYADQVRVCASDKTERGTQGADEISRRYYNSPWVFQLFKITGVNKGQCCCASRQLVDFDVVTS